jgi:hypothetical protein
MEGLEDAPGGARKQPRLEEGGGTATASGGPQGAAAFAALPPLVPAGIGVKNDSAPRTRDPCGGGEDRAIPGPAGIKGFFF